MGAAAIRTLLQKVDLKGLSEILRVELGKTTSAQKIKDIVKRLRTTEMLIESGNKAEWMVMTVIPVIPPDLRPLVLLDSGKLGGDPDQLADAIDLQSVERSAEIVS
jgi:DNA-directed RNA polymerase subunit beta'